MKYPPIHHRVKRNAARHAEVFLAGHILYLFDQIESGLLRLFVRSRRRPSGARSAPRPSCERTEFLNDRLGELIMLRKVMVQHLDIEFEIPAAVGRKHLLPEKLECFGFP